MRWSARTTAFWGFALTLILGTFLYLSGGVTVPAPEEMAGFLRSLGVWGPLAVIGLMILHSFVPFPAELLAVCAGAVFGTVLGAALIWVGAMLGALTAFYLARWLGREVISRWISPDQTRSLDQWSHDKGAITLLVCRFIPVIAFNLINYAAGLTRVGTWTFVWTTGLGILPVTLLCTWLGAQMRVLSWPMLLGLSVFCISVVFLIHTISRRRGWI